MGCVCTMPQQKDFYTRPSIFDSKLLIKTSLGIDHWKHMNIGPACS